MHRSLKATVLVASAVLLFGMWAVWGLNADQSSFEELHRAQRSELRSLALQSQALVAAAHDLVRDDAAAREALVRTHGELQLQIQEERAQLNEQRAALIAEQRELALARIRDPLIANAVLTIGMLLGCLLPLAVCVLAMWPARHEMFAGPLEQSLLELVALEEAAPTPEAQLPVNSPPSLPNAVPAIAASNKSQRTSKPRRKRESHRSDSNPSS